MKVLPRPPSKEVLKDYLKSLYFKASSPASFQGIQKFHRAVKEDKIYQVSRKEIEQFLNNVKAYSLFKNVKKVTRRPKVLVSGVDDQFEADLVVLDFPEMVQKNRGIRFLLVVIDVFSRYVWVEALSDKKASSIVEGFKKIFRHSKRIPRRIRTDRGREFTSEKTREFFKKLGVTQMFTSNELQANYVERVIKTLKTKLTRYQTLKNTLKYVDVLPKIVSSYNRTWHHGIREKPRNVTKDNEKQLWWQMYWPSGEKRNVSSKFLFSKGDFVRMSLRKTAFQREYSNKWTTEIFVISKRFFRNGICMYKLSDYSDEDITGTFYENELQKVEAPSKKDFSAKIVQEMTLPNGTVQVRIHYDDWSSKFSRWVNKETLLQKLSEDTKKHDFLVKKFLKERGEWVYVSYKNLSENFNRWIKVTSLK